MVARLMRTLYVAGPCFNSNMRVFCSGAHALATCHTFAPCRIHSPLDRSSMRTISTSGQIVSLPREIVPSPVLSQPFHPSVLLFHCLGITTSTVIARLAACTTDMGVLPVNLVMGSGNLSFKSPDCHRKTLDLVTWHLRSRCMTGATTP